MSTYERETASLRGRLVGIEPQAPGATTGKIHTVTLIIEKPNGDFVAFYNNHPTIFNGMAIDGYYSFVVEKSLRDINGKNIWNLKSVYREHMPDIIAGSDDGIQYTW